MCSLVFLRFSFPVYTAMFSNVFQFFSWRRIRMCSTSGGSNSPESGWKPFWFLQLPSFPVCPAALLLVSVLKYRYMYIDVQNKHWTNDRIDSASRIAYYHFDSRFQSKGNIFFLWHGHWEYCNYNMVEVNRVGVSWPTPKRIQIRLPSNHTPIKRFHQTNETNNIRRMSCLVIRNAEDTYATPRASL